MQAPLIYVYDDIGDAENARDALEAAGIAGDAMQLVTHDVEADGRLGDSPAATGDLTGDSASTASHGASEAGHRAFALAVTCTGTEQREDAMAIMEELGGIELARRSQDPAPARPPRRH